MKAKKKYGQNFLNDKNIINKIVLACDIKEGDLVVEIGPGRGALTKELLKTNAKVVAYEIDTDLKPILESLDNTRLKVIYDDFLNRYILDDVYDIKYNRLIVVGNLPYYITTPIISHIIDQKMDIESLTIMVQKEVADRFMAKPKSKEYGFYSVYLQNYFNIELVTNVSKSCFTPVPKVDSAVIKLVSKKLNVVNDDAFKLFVQKCFSMKRKTLKNNLCDDDYNRVISYLKTKGYDDKVRAEELPVEIYREIYKL